VDAGAACVLARDFNFLCDVIAAGWDGESIIHGAVPSQKQPCPSGSHEKWNRGCGWMRIRGFLAQFLPRSAALSAGSC
jgi:hypothetical protein